MKKSVVVYYSKTGSNRYLARKISEKLKCEIVELKPFFNSFIYIALTTAFKGGFGIRKTNLKVEEYDNIILVSPLWFGRPLSPLTDFIKKQIEKINKAYYITCCGSSDDNKDDKFGYESSFRYLKGFTGDKLLASKALSIMTIVSDELKNDDRAIMNTRLSDETYNSLVEEIINSFIKEIN